MGPVYTFNFLPRGLFLGISGGGCAIRLSKADPISDQYLLGKCQGVPTPLPGIFSVKNEHYQLLT